MKIKFIVVIIIVGVFFSSCKKNTSTSTNTNFLFKVKTQIETYSGGTDTMTFSYDAQGRMILWLAPNGNTSFEYPLGIVYQINNGDTTKFVLNTEGYRISDNIGGLYTYDNSWHSLIVAYALDSTSKTWTNGDISSLFSQEGGGTTQISYTYLSTPDKRDFGNSYTGVSGIHLVNTESVTDNGTTFTRIHTYLIDSIGRVIIDSVSSQGSLSLYKYTYLQ